MVIIILMELFLCTALADTDDCSKFKDYTNTSSTIKNVLNEMNVIALTEPDYAKVISLPETTDPVMPGGIPETIKAILVSKGAGAVFGNTTGKPAVIITGAIHANEWIGAEVALSIAKHLVTHATNNAPLFGSKRMNIESLLENIEVIVIPVLNPAGYRYSRNEHNRAAGCIACSPYDIDTDLNAYYEVVSDESGTVERVIGYDWYFEHPKPRYADSRKSRRDVSNAPNGPGGLGLAFGVDLNRNFPDFWDYPTDAGSNDPRDYGNYRGSGAGSEKETMALKSLYDIQSRKVKAHIDFHASRTLKIIAYPWAHTTDVIDGGNNNLRPDSNTKDKDLFPAMANKMTAGTVGYSIGQNQGFTAGGTVRDWAYNSYSTAAFNFEVTTSLEEFQPKWQLIAPICEENRLGALWLMFWAADQGFRNKPKLHLGN